MNEISAIIRQAAMEAAKEVLSEMQKQSVSPIQRKYVTRKEAAQYTGVSVGTIIKWQDAGKIKPLKPEGGRTLYEIEAIDKFIKGQDAECTKAQRKA